MPDFGARLRAAREKRGVSLRDIADTTKISIAALEALERDDPSRLPGGIFMRSIVRSYATQVGLDPDRTLKDFLDRFNLDPGPATLEAQHAFERSARSDDLRLGATFVKIVLASLIAAIILYLALAGRPDNQAPGPQGSRVLGF